MRHSLRLKLLLMTVAVAGIAIGAVGLVSSRVTITQFQAFVSSDDHSRLDRFAVMISERYAADGQWTHLQPLVEEMGKMARKRLLVFDLDRRLMAASPAGLLHARVEVTPEHRVTLTVQEQITEEKGRPAPGTHFVRESEIAIAPAPHAALTNGGGPTVGTLYMLPMDAPGTGTNDLFIRTVNRSLVLAVVLALLVAVVSAFLLAGRILRPVEALTIAARRMERGDLAARVDPTARDEIGELGRAFNAMADALARAEGLRRSMVTDIAHELRTPLTNIRGQLEALQDGLAQPDTAALQSIHEEALLLGRLVEDLQELALAESGQLPLSRRPLDAKAEIERAINASLPGVRAAHLNLDVTVPDGLPEVDADPERLGQVLRNLLGNAVRYTPPGGIIEVSAALDLNAVQVSVRNTGNGIDPEHMPYIFERFYRADRSRARTTGGAGLGLAVVKQLVGAHGGRVWAESSPGEGARFCFTLPLAAAAKNVTAD